LERYAQTDVPQEGLFVVRKTSDYVPEGHPLLAIREILNHALRDMDVLFEPLYEDRGRYSVPPEWLLRGLVLQALNGIRSERLLCEELGYNMLYRWFVSLGMEDAAWDHSTYTQNRDRLIEHDVIRALFGRVMNQAETPKLISADHFSVDGNLIRAWASHKSFVPKDGPPPDKSGSKSTREVDFKRQKHINETHASTTDPDARLFTKSRKVESILASMGHVLMENRSKLAVDTRLTHATGTTECEAALDMLAARADEARTTKHRGYAVSQVIRKLIETLFGDGKQHGGTIRQVKPRARTKLGMCSRWPCSLSICDACQRCLRRALVSPTLDRQERCARFAFRHANPAKSAKQGQSPAKASFTIITLENHHDSEYAFANQANFNELF